MRKQIYLCKANMKYSWYLDTILKFRYFRTQRIITFLYRNLLYLLDKELNILLFKDVLDFKDIEFKDVLDTKDVWKLRESQTLWISLTLIALDSKDVLN